MVVVLSEKDREKIFDTLTDKQIRVIKRYVLDIVKSELLTKYFWKGINWDLVGLEYDPLFHKKLAERVSQPRLFCSACGKPLKNQYIVKSKQTGYIQELGSTCLADRAGIDIRIVKEIHNSRKRINLFQDEILSDYRNKERFPNRIYKDIIEINADRSWGPKFRSKILDFKGANLPLFHKDHNKLLKDLSNRRNELDEEEQFGHKDKVRNNTQEYIHLKRYINEIVRKDRSLNIIQKEETLSDALERITNINNSINDDFAVIPISKQKELAKQYIDPFNQKLSRIRKVKQIDSKAWIDEAVKISTIIMSIVQDFNEIKDKRINEYKRVVQEVNDVSKTIPGKNQYFEPDLTKNIDEEIAFYKQYLEELKLEKKIVYYPKNLKKRLSEKKSDSKRNLSAIQDDLNRSVTLPEKDVLVKYYLLKQEFYQDFTLDDFDQKSESEQVQILEYASLKAELIKEIYKFEIEITARKNAMNNLINEINGLAKGMLDDRYIHSAERDRYISTKVLYYDNNYSTTILRLKNEKQVLENFVDKFSKYPQSLLNNLEVASEKIYNVPSDSRRIMHEYVKQLHIYEKNRLLIDDYRLLLEYYFMKSKETNNLKKVRFSQVAEVLTKEQFKKLNHKNKLNRLQGIYLINGLVMEIKKYIIDVELAKKIKRLNELREETDGKNYQVHHLPQEILMKADVDEIKEYSDKIDKNIQYKEYIKKIEVLINEIYELQEELFGNNVNPIDVLAELQNNHNLKLAKTKFKSLSNIKEELEIGLKRTHNIWREPEFDEIRTPLHQVIAENIFIEKEDLDTFESIKQQAEELELSLTDNEKQVVEYFLRKKKFMDSSGKIQQNLYFNNIDSKTFELNKLSRKIFIEYYVLKLKLEKYIYYYNKLESNSAYIRELEKIISMNGKIVKTKIKKNSGDPEELSTLLKDNLNIFRSTNNNKSQEYALIFSDYNNKIMKILHLSKKQGNNLEFIKESIEYLMDKYQSKKYLVKSNAKSKKSKYLDTYQDELDIKWKKDLIESMFKVEDEINWDKVKYKIVNYLSDYRIQINDEWKQELINLLFEINYNYFGNFLSDLSKENEAALINRNMLFLGFMNNTIKQLSKM
ncbi:hypothetical protein [Ligilactobacillus salivarius]|uniref:hypothetical protein n=1 Tax=Ligilactobacillus salivarius TaxID=1624 RepID=UPI001E36C0FF|nr:hypothetical protein [Ligilactobacillus salivarius]UHL93822.1 hypothetical protein LVD18_11060 [Ligilactobacillus salivarius]